MKSFFLAAVIAIVPALSVAENLNSFPSNMPSFSAAKHMEVLKSTDFSSASEATRGIGKDVFDKALPSVVKVFSEDGSSGAGSVIEYNGELYILTNEHVTAGGAQVGIVFHDTPKDADYYLGRVLRENQQKDLALVKLYSMPKDALPLKLALAPTEIDDDVFVIGHPIGYDWTFTRGYVSQVRDSYAWNNEAGNQNLADLIQTQTPINYGNSGGPILNDKAEIVGVVSWGWGEVDSGLNFGIAVSSVVAFLDERESVRFNPIIKAAAHETLIDTDDENKNGQADYYAWDTDDNGVPDKFGWDEDEDLTLEYICWDRNENSVCDIRVFPNEGSGLSWIQYDFDEDEDEVVETIGYDYDKDGNIDKLVPQ